MIASVARRRGSALRAAFLRSATVKAWSSAELGEWIRRIAASPLNTIIFKAQSITPELIDICLAEGLTVVSSVACFSDHEMAWRVPSRLRPIDDHGRVFSKQVWYEGVIPTDAGYNSELAERVYSASTVHGVAGVTLDFLRWPLHWSTELHQSGPGPRHSSFDPISLRRFCSWLTRRGIDTSGISVARPGASARKILGSLSAEWVAFRCETITSLAEELVEITHAAQKWAGIYIVPVPDAARRQHLGQDTATLGRIADLLLPMTYHGIMNEPPEWTIGTSEDVAATTTAELVPAVQSTAEERFAAGNDWGPEIDASEFATIAGQLDRKFGGFFVFPGEGIDGERMRLLTDELGMPIRQPISQEPQS